MGFISKSVESCIKILSPQFDAGFQFHIEIDHIKSRNIPNGQYISSPTFSFLGGNWALLYYPQGKTPENQENSSIFLVLLSKRSTIPVDYFFKVLAKTACMNALSEIVQHTFKNNNNISGYEYFLPKDRLDTDFCIDGKINVHCNMRINPQREFPIPLPGGLQEHIENLWTRQEDFDVTFEVEGERISAHKIILGARSPVFKAELFGHMTEAKLNYIKIEDMESEVFKALIYFIYTDKLEPFITAGTCSTELLENLFVAADRYSLDKLKTLCERQLAANLSIDKFAPTLVLADRHNGVFLKEKCFEFASNPDHFMELAFTDEYLQAMNGIPSLKDEFRETVKKLRQQNNSPKRQRTEL